MESLDSGTQHKLCTISLVIAVTTPAPILVWRAPYKCKLVGIKAAVGTTIVASDTVYWTVEFINRGSTGLLTTALNAATTTMLTGGITLTANVAATVPLSATAASLILAAGDIVTLTLTETYVTAPGEVTPADMPIIDFEIVGTA